MGVSHWDVKGECLHQWSHPSRARDFCVTPDGTQPIVANVERELIFYDLQSDNVVCLPLEAKPTSVVASQDRKTILVDLASGEVQLIDIETKAVVRSFRGQHAGTFVITSIFFGPEESLIVSGSEDGRVYIWDRNNGALLDILEGHGFGCVDSISVNPANPDMLVSTGDDCTSRVWSRQQSGDTEDWSDVEMVPIDGLGGYFVN
ncbi:WD40 repeat domain-containing protein [Aspergillus undulatus]|uniref:WD40 repeat domain-containing protein n=1 Tax=Aspergillus undulatus TaxID=1810928 RepID=UPI003CCD6445